MTPLRDIIRRFRGDASHDAPSSDEPNTPPEARTRRNAASPATGGGPILTEDPKKRRRGRRGGRGRNRGEAARAESTSEAAPSDAVGRSERSPNGASSTKASSSPNGRASNGRNKKDDRKDNGSSRSNGRSRNGSSEGSEDKPRATRDSYNWGRRVDSDEADQRSRQANRRRRGIRRADLDAPLPEDVAFRPGDEGGDSSILPTRRRRPVGFHDTARTLVGGARSIGTWVKRDTRHGHDLDTSGDPDHDAEETNAADPGEEAADRNVSRAARQLVVSPKAEGASTAEAPSEARTAEPPATADDETDEAGTDDNDEDRPRRRRGRRGGRGRRRPGAVVDDSNEAPSELEAVSEADDTDEDADEEDDRDEVAPQRERRAPAARREFVPVPDDALPTAFATLGIHRTNLEQLARFGFAEPTPIQEQAIPALLNGLDVVGIAQTGSGKTIAFATPMVEKLDPSTPEVQGIVLVPTRELAQQVLDVLTEVAAPWGLEAVGLLGGRSLKADFRALDARPHIVVGTPGRILDHLGRQTLSLRHVRYAVLDEADQMLDIGFLPDIRRILSRTPQRRQTALFSATMPSSIRRLIWQFMTDPETVRVDPEATTVDTIEQIYFEVAQRDKVRAMRELIERELKGRSLIFCNMKRSVDHLARELSRDGVSVRALHGDLDQRQRDRVVQEFREGKIDALIATNVAARGLDIPEITHVVNYDVPQNLEEYVHRIGRTGRAGRDGKAITFVCEWDIDAFDQIEQGVPSGIRREELDLYRPDSEPEMSPTSNGVVPNGVSANGTSVNGAHPEESVEESAEDASEEPADEDTAEAIPVPHEQS